MLRVVHEFDLEEPCCGELPRGAAYRLHLDWQSMAIGIGCQDVEVGYISRKWGCDEAASPQFDHNKVFSDLSRDLRCSTGCHSDPVAGLLVPVQ
jgi:hypothetical protein